MVAMAGRPAAGSDLPIPTTSNPLACRPRTMARPRPRVLPVTMARGRIWLRSWGLEGLSI